MKNHPTRTSSLSEAANLDNNFAFLMANIIYKLDHDFSITTLSKYKMTYVQYRVLQFLNAKDGKTIGEIAKSIVIRQPVLSRIIDQMQEKELLVKQPDPNDGRFTRVYLTEQGQKCLSEVWPIAKDIINDVMVVLDSSEQDQLLSMLRKISNHLLVE